MDRQTTFLLLLAVVLIYGCGVLALGVRVVPGQQIVVVSMAVLYTLLASCLQLPVKARRLTPLAVEAEVSQETMRVLIVTSLLVSVVLPWVWVIIGATMKQMRMLGPPLFVMMAQVLFEIWSHRSTVSAIVRIGIPVAFVSYRLWVILEWVNVSIASLDGWNGCVMVLLSCLNLAYWSTMFFYVLLLKVCPPYFKDAPCEINRI